MGLDMYLYLDKYESKCAWDFRKDYNEVIPPEVIEKVVKKFYPSDLLELGKKNFEWNFLTKETRYQVGYWRKANAIHQWFVNKCAKGEDDCKPIYVEKEELEELLDACNKVLENHDLANELLPTTSGFFFGSVQYDEWYFKELEYTKELLESVLNTLKKSKNRYSIIYQASW